VRLRVMAAFLLFVGFGSELPFMTLGPRRERGVQVQGGSARGSAP